MAKTIASACQSSTKNADQLLDSALERLRQHGLKQTGPLTHLLKALVEITAPFSADDVFKAVSHSRGTLSVESKAKAKAKAKSQSTGSPAQNSTRFDLVTVYRSLSTFNEAGILARVDLDDGVVRYEWSDPSGHHHHHFVCTSCRKIEPLDLCAVDGPIQSQELILKRKGYSRVVHRLEFYGICPACSTLPASTDGSVD